MPSELENKIEKLFLSNVKEIKENDLFSLLKESYIKKIQEKGEAAITQPAQISINDIAKILPKYEFNEKAVGKVSTDDRKQFELFMGPQIKAANDLKSKISIINNFANLPKTSSNDTQGILSSLMMLKILKNIVVGSSPGPSGYQFEAFFAALFGGEQIDVAKGGAVDVIVGGTKYQLKLLKPNSSVRIARTNIEKLSEDIEAVANKPLQAKNELNFIIANKIGTDSTQQVAFYVLENVIPVIGDGRAEYVISSDVYSKKENHVGTLNISDKAFSDLSVLLQNNVVKVLSDVTSLVNNINQFYFASDTKAARDGIDNANAISGDLTSQTK